MAAGSILPVQDSFEEHVYRLTDINAVNLSLSLDAMPIACGDLHYDAVPGFNEFTDRTTASFPLFSAWLTALFRYSL